MNKEQLIELMNSYGDAIITYRSPESNKLKYNVCTLEMSGNDYIDSKQNRARESDDTLLMFCWDVDAYRLLKPASVTKVEALGSVLRERESGR